MVREVSGTDGVVVEHRRGNIIRRRKKDDEVEDAGDTLAVDDAQAAEGPMSRSQPLKSREEALALGDTLFSAPSAAEPSESENGVSPEAQGIVSDADAAVEPQDVTADEELATSDAQGSAEVEVVAVAEADETSADESVEVEASDGSLHLLRQRHDVRAPKVLGKIDLPKPPVAKASPPPAKPRDSSPSGETTETTIAPAEGDGERGRTKRKTVVENGTRDGANRRRRSRNRYFARTILSTMVRSEKAGVADAIVARNEWGVKTIGLSSKRRHQRLPN